MSIPGGIPHLLDAPYGLLVVRLSHVNLPRPASPHRVGHTAAKRRGFARLLLVDLLNKIFEIFDCHAIARAGSENPSKIRRGKI